MPLPATYPSHVCKERNVPTMAPFEFHVPYAGTSISRTMPWKHLEPMDRFFLLLFSSHSILLHVSTQRSRRVDGLRPSFDPSLDTSTSPSSSSVHVRFDRWVSPPPSPPHERTPTRTDARLVYVPLPQPRTWSGRTLRLPAERPQGQRSLRSIRGPRRSCWGRAPPPPTVFTNELTSWDVRVGRDATRFDVRQRRRRRHERSGRMDGSHPRVRLRVHGSRAPRNHRTHGAWWTESTTRWKGENEAPKETRARRTGEKKKRGMTRESKGSKGLTRCTTVEWPLLRTSCVRRSLAFSTVRECHQDINQGDDKETQEAVQAQLPGSFSLPRAGLQFQPHAKPQAGSSATKPQKAAPDPVKKIAPSYKNSILPSKGESESSSNRIPAARIKKC